MYNKQQKGKLQIGINYQQQKNKLINSLTKIEPETFSFDKWSKVHNKYHIQYLVREYVNNNFKIRPRYKEALYKSILQNISSRIIKSADIDMENNHISFIHRLIIGENGHVDIQQTEETKEKDTTIPLMCVEWNKFLSKASKNINQSNYLPDNSSSISSIDSSEDNSRDMSEDTLVEDTILPGIMDDSIELDADEFEDGC